MYERKLTLPLTESEWRVLCDTARLVDRTPKLQARHILKEALGLTPTTNATNPAAKVSQAKTAGFAEATL